jgi:hypothetical protein
MKEKSAGVIVRGAHASKIAKRGAASVLVLNMRRSKDGPTPGQTGGPSSLPCPPSGCVMIPNIGPQTVQSITPQPTRKYTDYLACVGTQYLADVMATDLGPALVGSLWASGKAVQIAGKAAIRTGTRGISGGGAYVGAEAAAPTLAIVFDAYFAVRLLIESIGVHDQCATQVYGGW